ncbi:MAG: CCA tRNA nucleotidyltransferase [Crenarchaeota archaeon]|nr:CCA tRNA nucleotidyltransferase [Thermoproteota archaeon]
MTLLHEELEEEVLSRIRPTEDEIRKRDEIFEKVREAVSSSLSRRGLEGEVTLQGSARKGTWLRGQLELDVFVLFKPSKKEWLERVAFPALFEAANLLGKASVRYAEHPYVRVEVEGVPVELVPAFKVESASEAITAVDRTPFHTEWFLSKVNELGGWVVDEVRLLKAFFKGIGAYGAEIKVMGFSGYMTEVLIVYHKGFAETMRAMARWKPPVVLETSLDKRAALKKFRGPLIAPDPTDPNRNAAAAVSENTLALSVLAARRYLDRPSLRFYFKPPPPRVAPRLPTFVVEIPLRGGSPPETVWGELRRVSKSARKELERLGFQVTRVGLWSDEVERAAIAIEFLEDVLPEFEVRKGPPVWLERHAESFLEKHGSSTIWVEGGRVFALERRKVRTASDALGEVFSKFKTESLDLDSLTIRRVEGAPEEGWLAWFVWGKPSWWG